MINVDLTIETITNGVVATEVKGDLDKYFYSDLSKLIEAKVCEEIVLMQDNLKHTKLGKETLRLQFRLDVEEDKKVVG